MYGPSSVDRCRKSRFPIYSEDAVFRDLEDIPFGADFRDYLAKVLEDSEILLVVIGPRWFGRRGGQSRLADPNGPVRVEVETALGKGLPIIPILVGRTSMPKPEQLPDSLKKFAYRNGLRVDTGPDFDHHLARLIQAMDGILTKVVPTVPVPPREPPEVEEASVVSVPERESSPPSIKDDETRSQQSGSSKPSVKYAGWMTRRRLLMATTATAIVGALGGGVYKLLDQKKERSITGSKSDRLRE